MIPVLASLTWDPGIRGILVVVVAVAILCGTPLILLATNLGARIGTYVGLTVLFGWLTVMFFFWGVYGLGYQGPDPHWQVLDKSNTPEMAFNEQLHNVPQPDQLASPESFAEDNPNVADAIEGETYPSLGEVVAADPDIEAKLKADLNGWRLQPAGSHVASDVAAAAGEELQEEGFNGTQFQSKSSFEVGDVFDRGGKPLRGDSSMMGRVTHRIQSTAMWFVAANPAHYAVVQIRPTVPQTELPGEPPPQPVIDENQPVINVLLVRDLGAVRQPAFAFGTLSLIVFAILCYQLHQRDKAGMAARAATESATSEA